MASVVQGITTKASVADAWAAIRDVGALHTRLVPGFVIDTKMEGDVRVVTFANGTIVREPIVTLDDAARRLVWTAEGGMTRHYNASVQVTALPTGETHIVWIADFLPDSAKPAIAAAIGAGMAAMKTTLDRLGARAPSVDD